ncbi:MAG: class I SAM-dependent methyltransferase [Deltaproteobacteria bacterium]|nr:class I SAM-dependent methyltransferase [Deltaproteobacteria bacterium]
MRVRIGDVDWVSRFSELAAAAEAEGDRPSDRWRDRAARFDRMSRTAAGDGGTIEGLALVTRPEDVALDIGAGTGRHAVPLSRRCARVIALEPSPAMRQRLVSRVEEEGLRNVEVRGESWPLPERPAADVVYSAHVVYGIVEIVGFLEAMTAAARRICALLLKLRAPSDALAEVHEAVHGTRRPRRPAALEALAVLHQLGLQASLTIVEGTGRPLVFGDDEDDLRELALRVGVAPDHAGIARVRDALGRTCEREGETWKVADVGPTALVTWPGAGSAADGCAPPAR